MFESNNFKTTQLRRNQERRKIREKKSIKKKIREKKSIKKNKREEIN